MKIEKKTYYLLVGLLLIVGGFFLVRHWTNLTNYEDYEDSEDSEDSEDYEDSEDSENSDIAEDPEETEKPEEIRFKKPTNETKQDTGQTPAD